MPFVLWCILISSVLCLTWCFFLVFLNDFDCLVNKWSVDLVLVCWYMVLSSQLFLKILVESNRFHYALLLVWYLWYSALSAWILLAIKGEEKGNFRCCWVPFQFSFSVLIFSSQILYSFFVSNSISVWHRFWFSFCFSQILLFSDKTNSHLSPARNVSSPSSNPATSPHLHNPEVWRMTC